MTRFNRGLAFVTFAGSLVISSPILAQRGGHSGDSGGRSNGGDSGRSSSGGRSESRSESAPRRESSAPSRSESAPRHEYSAPPSRRDDYTPRRDYSTRDYTPRHDDTSYRSGDSTYRRSDYGTRSESTSGRDYTFRRDSSRDPSDDWLPRRSSSTTRDRTRIDHNDSSGRGRDSIVGRGHNPDVEGPHDIFSRTSPGRTQDRAPDRTIDRTNAGRRTGSFEDSRGSRTRTNDPAPMRDRGHELFVRTSEGRRYNNGIILRDRYYNPPASISFFFGGGGCYYPWYAPVYNSYDCYYSPFSFYYGCGPSYIYRRHTYYYPPPAIFIEVPIYSGNDCRGYDSNLNDYYLDRDRYDARDLREIGLESAIDDIREAFRFGEVEALVDHTDPAVKIAVFRKGSYDYSMDPADYLDATRDAMRTMETIQVDLYRVHHRAEGVYVISGKHVYRNREGERRTVYVSFVMEHLNGRWILTQVGTAPDRIQEPR